MTHRTLSTTNKQIVNEVAATNVTSKASQQSIISSENKTSDLPALPQKKRNRNQIVTQHHFTLPTSYNKQKKRTTDNRRNATLERIATKKSSEAHIIDSQHKDNSKDSNTDSTVTKMHYHNSSDMPKYLFGERTKHYHHHQSKPLKNDEIFLNKSGWVQVNSRDPENKHFGGSYGGALSNLDDNRLNAHRQQLERDSLSFRKYSADLLKGPGSNLSKIEALISRNEIRKNAEQNKLMNKVKCAIDPQMSALLSERPGFLPIKRFDDNESPPPITPIISPPPAFQDNNTSPDKEKPSLGVNAEASNNKGMVFSRSFEYDTRKPFEYEQTFSKSFDYDFLSPSKEDKKFEKENNFTNLTGISPNYLSKKPNSTTPTKFTRDSSASGYQQYLDPKNYIEPVRKSRIRTGFSLRPDSLDQQQQQQQAERSRRGQFSKQESSSSASGSNRGFRSQQSSVSKRLNSCDSGARSGNFKIYEGQN